MLESILKLYVMAMATGVTSPLPHLFGPPGCGKSTVAEQLADLVGKRLHILNVSRISPLEIEGVQMPTSEDDGEGTIRQKLELLLATFWNNLREGDIVLLDEFLRGFPEVYNGLLDIITSRQVGGHVLPRVFIMAASNSFVTYDVALEDRLIHLPVPDPRKKKREKRRLGEMIVERLGLLPEMIDSMEMQSLLDAEVLPMFEVLDSLKNKSSSLQQTKGSSVRKLIGQALLREVQSAHLQELLDMNNRRAISSGKLQFVFLTSGAKVDPAYPPKAKQLQGNPRLSEIQAQNLDLNLQLIEMETIRHEKEGTTTDDEIDDDVFS